MLRDPWGQGHLTLNILVSKTAIDPNTFQMLSTHPPTPGRKIFRCQSTAGSLNIWWAGGGRRRGHSTLKLEAPPREKSRAMDVNGTLYPNTEAHKSLKNTAVSLCRYDIETRTPRFTNSNHKPQQRNHLVSRFSNARFKIAVFPATQQRFTEIQPSRFARTNHYTLGQQSNKGHPQKGALNPGFLLEPFCVSFCNIPMSSNCQAE